MISNQQIFDSVHRKDFIIAAKEYANFTKHSNHLPPLDITTRYLTALKKYTDFLEKNFIYSKMPVWGYDKDDKSTWKYVDFQIKNNGRSPSRCIWIKNTNWKYAKKKYRNLDVSTTKPAATA